MVTVIKRYALFFIALIIFCNCTNNNSRNNNNHTKKSNNTKNEDIKKVNWLNIANIYEVNIRQYTPEGTFNAFKAHIPRLKNIGVKVLWLMPIYPIGQKNRKGKLGSPYAIKNYKAVNPDLGTMQDLKQLVNEIHTSGMYVILDWVANHTAWDCNLITEHPEWYTKKDGKIISPEGTDWADVADLNYDNQELRTYMISAMKFWIKEAGIDGFRCDVAGMVPVNFWELARKELDKEKNVFMLAEAWEPELLVNAFDVCYGWDLHHVMNEVAKGKKNVSDIDVYFNKVSKQYKPKDIIMNFTSNHDENSWNGTANERMGDASKAMAVLCATVPGIPLIYSSQEAGETKSLSFFEKDNIDWKSGTDLSGFYRILLHLKANNKALWSGETGGKMIRLKTSDDNNVLAFIREKDNNKILVIINLSANEQKVTFRGKKHEGKYLDVFTLESMQFEKDQEFVIKPWDYKVYKKK